MPEVDSQLKLASVLRYLRRGDFGAFKRAAELAGYVESDNERFAAADIFLACQMAGFIEVESADGERAWWSTLDRAIEIRSEHPKVIPTKREGPRISGTLRSLIHDSGGQSLIWGTDKAADPATEACDFGPGFLGRLPRLAAIERQATRLERLSAEFAMGQAEWFSPEDTGWRPLPTTESPTQALLRVRREYGPWTYLVTMGKSREAILLVDQEWALPIARNILGWPLSRVLRTEDTVTRLARAFRLPCLLLRFIFANAQSVTLGPWLQVHGLDRKARDELTNYLEEAA